MEPYVILNLRETYHELGSYEFKIVLDSKRFSVAHGAEVEIIDSDRKPVRTEARVWGRKINCNFLIDGSVADGVSRATFRVKDDNGTEVKGSFSFWIIKP